MAHIAADATTVDWWSRLAPYVASLAAIIAAALGFYGLSRQIAANTRQQRLQAEEDRANAAAELQRKRDAVRRKLASLNFAAYSMMIHVVKSPLFADDQVATVIDRFIVALLADDAADALTDSESRALLYAVPLIEASSQAISNTWSTLGDANASTRATAEHSLRNFARAIIAATADIAEALGDAATHQEASGLLREVAKLREPIE